MRISFSDILWSAVFRRLEVTFGAHLRKHLHGLVSFAPALTEVTQSVSVSDELLKVIPRIFKEFPVYSDIRIVGRVKLSAEQNYKCSIGFDLSVSKDVLEKQCFISKPWHSVFCDLFASLLRWICYVRIELKFNDHDQRLMVVEEAISQMKHGMAYTWNKGKVLSYGG